MKYNLRLSTCFKKNLKKYIKRGLNTKKLDDIVEKLQKGETLGERYRDHVLINYKKDRYKIHA